MTHNDEQKSNGSPSIDGTVSGSGSVSDGAIDPSHVGGEERHEGSLSEPEQTCGGFGPARESREEVLDRGLSGLWDGRGEFEDWLALGSQARLDENDD